jgi:hypothetical protein
MIAKHGDVAHQLQNCVLTPRLALFNTSPSGA